MLKTNKGECFERPLFPGYVFFSGGRTDNRIFYCFAACQRFLRILRDNANPVKFTGTALEELKLFIHNGEHRGISQVQFLPGKKSGSFQDHLSALKKIFTK